MPTIKLSISYFASMHLKYCVVNIYLLPVKVLTKSNKKNECAYTVS